MAFKPSFNPETGVVKALVRLSYFNGFRKTASTEGGKLMYRTNGLVPKETPEGIASKRVIDKAIAHLIGKEWPGKVPEKLLKAFDSKRLPVFDGDEYLDSNGDVREHYEDNWYLKLNSDKKPKYKTRSGEDVDEEEREELFVSGHWAVAYFHYYAVKDKAKGGNGIFATLDALQYYKRDEQFTGGSIDDDEIDDLGDEEDDEDEEETKSYKSKPAKRRASSIDDDDDEEDERPSKSKPTKRRASAMDDDDI